MTATFWTYIACWVLIIGAPAAWWVYRVLTGPKPSAAEVAAAEMAATPAHPAGKAIPEPAPFDAGEWERRYAAAHTPAPRRDQ